MNKLCKEIINNITNFLLPRDILRFRYLSKEYSKIITQYLLEKRKVELLTLVCPMCGNDWIDTEDISSEIWFEDLNDELDKLYIMQRLKYISEKNHVRQDYICKKHLLCNMCEEITLFTQPNINNFKLYKYCNYSICIDDFSQKPWALLTFNTGSKLYWNQLKCFKFNSYSSRFYDDYEDDEDDEDDEENDYDENNYDENDEEMYNL